jgi:hypothetical protein
MSPAEGTGSERERDSGEDIVLPSWIDAAISRTRSEGEPLESYQESLPEEAVEPMADEPPTEEYPRPLTPLVPPSTEPFPTFLDRRDSMAYETERIADEPSAHEPVSDEAPTEVFTPELVEEYQQQLAPAPQDFLARRLSQDFDAQREAIVTEAMSEDPVARSEPIPLPVAPPRRRAPSGPWLMAALFFAAAALVLAILIWLRPLPK